MYTQSCIYVQPCGCLKNNSVSSTTRLQVTYIMIYILHGICSPHVNVFPPACPLEYINTQATNAMSSHNHATTITWSFSDCLLVLQVVIAAYCSYKLSCFSPGCAKSSVRRRQKTCRVVGHCVQLWQDSEFCPVDNACIAWNCLGAKFSQKECEAKFHWKCCECHAITAFA